MKEGTAIKMIRKRQALSQVELAQRCNISQTSLSQIENNLKRPRGKTLKKLCEVMEVPESMVYILGLEETDVPQSKLHLYNMLYPTIINMACQIVGEDSKIEMKPD
jgi:XRE family transcriptional regulator, regulator of sulfur utilization